MGFGHTDCKSKSSFVAKLNVSVGAFYFVILFAIQIVASPASLTYQGRILKSDGRPLEYSNVSFIFQITNPAGTCVIYQEQVSGFDMTNSAGVFDLPIGLGTIQYPLSGTVTILDVFNNTNSYSCGSCSLINGEYTCSNGSGTYAASAGDTRKLRASFYDGSGWKTITPDNVIRSVPFAGYALSAQKLGSNTAADFLLKAGLPSCGAGTFLTYDGTALSCLSVTGASGGTVTTVTSTNSYLTVVNNTSTPTITANVGTAAGTLAAGDDPRLSNARTPIGAANGVLTGSYPSPGLADNAVTETKISDGAISTAKIFPNPGINRLVATDTSTGSTLEPLTCASGQLIIWSVANGWQCTSQNSLAVGSASTATTAATSTNFTGALVGDVSGTQGATSVDKIKGVPLDFSAAPLNGQVLKFNGTNWVAASDGNAGGTITALTSDVSASGSGSVTATVNSVGGSTASDIHSAELAANAATNANTVSTIVKRDASGNFSAGTISANLTGNVNGNVTGLASLNVLKAGDAMTGHLTFNANKGNIYTDSGVNTVTVQAPTTVSTSYVLKLPSVQGSLNQVLTNDGAGNLSWTSPASSPSLADGKIWVGQSGTPTEIAPNGDLSMNNTGAFSVVGIQGKAVSATAPTTAGQVLRYDGTSTYIPGFLKLADIKAGITPFGGAFENAGCAASQSLYWQSSTDTFQCQSVAIGDSAITYASRTANTFLAAPNGSAGAPTFRGIVSADLPSISSGLSGTLPVANGGTGTTTGSITGTSALTFAAGGTNQNVTLTPSGTGYTLLNGNVGIGTISPLYPLSVNGAINSSSGAAGTGFFVLGDPLDPSKYMGMWRGTANATSVGNDLNFQGLNGIHFMTTANTANSFGNGTERLTITGAGNVGIGTTSPSFLTDIGNGTGAPTVRINGGTAVNQGGLMVFAKNGANNNYVGHVSAMVGGISEEGLGLYSSDSVRFYTLGANQERMRILSNGNVGIGVTAPANTLHVNGGITSNNLITSTIYNKSNTGYYLYDDAGNGGWRANGNFLVNGNLWLGYIGNWASNLINQSVTTGAVPTFAGLALSYSTGLTQSFQSFYADGEYYVALGHTGGVTRIQQTTTGFCDMRGNVSCASDGRLKDKVGKVTSALDKISHLNGIFYRWKKNTGWDRSRIQLGVIAQEVACVDGKVKTDDKGDYVIGSDKLLECESERLLPEAVHSGTVELPSSVGKKIFKRLTVNYDLLVVPLIEAVKDITAKLQASDENSTEEFQLIHRELASVKEENVKLKQENAEIKERLQKIENALNSK